MDYRKLRKPPNIYIALRSVQNYLAYSDYFIKSRFFILFTFKTDPMEYMWSIRRFFFVENLNNFKSKIMFYFFRFYLNFSFIKISNK